jgi:hypothetical protein
VPQPSARFERGADAAVKNMVRKFRRNRVAKIFTNSGFPEAGGMFELRLLPGSGHARKKIS